MAERKGIDPKILELFTSPNPDLDQLIKNPGGVAEEWKQMLPRAWDLARQKPENRNRSLATHEGAEPPQSGLDSLGMMASRRPFREASFSLTLPNDGISIDLRVTNPDDEEVVHGWRSPAESHIFRERNTSVTNHWSELSFRTSAWKAGRWFVAPTDPAQISPLLVACVGVILDLDKRGLAVSGDDPSYLHLGHS